MNWNQAVSDIGPRLYRYFSASFAPQVASDLTQDTLIRLVKKYNDGAFDPAQGSLVMFAYGIARLVRLETWKDDSPEEPFGDPSDYDRRSVSPASDGQVYEEEIRARRLREAINGLNEVQKQIVLLHIDQELTLQEIGVLVGLPLNTVKSHIHRAKENLRTKMNQEGVENE